MDLSKICYEHIQDAFYYGIFGNFKLVIDKDTSCFNATKLCSDNGKIYHNWSCLEKSKNMIEYYQNKYLLLKDSFIYKIDSDYYNVEKEKIIGTYVPKELILDIASWISIELYDRCNNIVGHYFIEEFEAMDIKTLQLKVKESEKQMEKLTIENEYKENIITRQKDKIDQLLDSNTRLENYIISLGIAVKELTEKNNDTCCFQ